MCKKRIFLFLVLFSLDAGENIADMGGLKISMLAYENLHKQKTGREPSGQDKRVFFVSFAQVRSAPACGQHDFSSTKNT
jgi:predicted metalloendopeptidase